MKIKVRLQVYLIFILSASLLLTSCVTPKTIYLGITSGYTFENTAEKVFEELKDHDNKAIEKNVL